MRRARTWSRMCRMLIGLHCGDRAGVELRNQSVGGSGVAVARNSIEFFSIAGREILINFFTVFKPYLLAPKDLVDIYFVE